MDWDDPQDFRDVWSVAKRVTTLKIVRLRRLFRARQHPIPGGITRVDLTSTQPTMAVKGYPWFAITQRAPARGEVHQWSNDPYVA